MTLGPTYLKLQKASQDHNQLVRSFPRLSVPSCHLLEKINAMGIFFSTRHLCLKSKCLNMMEITDVLQRRIFPQHLFSPVDGRMVLRVQEWRPQAVYVRKFQQKNCQAAPRYFKKGIIFKQKLSYNNYFGFTDQQ